MRKKLLFIIIFFMLLAIGLSGCFETNNNTDNGVKNYVEIVEWYQGTYKEIGKILYNDLVYNESARLYIVNGTARNNAQKTLYSVIIWVKYYDVNNTLLWEDGLLANGKAHNQTWRFDSFYTRDIDHFEDVDHVEFDFTGKFDE